MTKYAAVELHPFQTGLNVWPDDSLEEVCVEGVAAGRRTNLTSLCLTKWTTNTSEGLFTTCVVFTWKMPQRQMQAVTEEGRFCFYF